MKEILNLKKVEARKIKIISCFWIYECTFYFDNSTEKVACIEVMLIPENNGFNLGSIKESNIDKELCNPENYTIIIGKNIKKLSSLENLFMYIDKKIIINGLPTHLKSSLVVI